MAASTPNKQRAVNVIMSNPDPAAIREAVQGRAKVFQTEDKATPRPGKVFLPLEAMLVAPVEPDWILPGYLNAGSFACLYGESGCMKSFCALDLGLSIASGHGWHGVKVPRPGPVAYIAAEGGTGMRKRIRAWIAEFKPSTPVPFYVLPEPVDMLAGLDLEALTVGLEKIAQRHGGLRLVVFDTLARTIGAGDENTAKDMGAYVSAVDRVRARFAGCTALVVHHTGLQEKSRARGSSALKGAADWEYCLEQRGEIRVLTCHKSKDYESAPTRVFKPHIVNIGWRDPVSGDELTSCVLELTEDSPRIIQGLTCPQKLYHLLC